MRYKVRIMKQEDSLQMAGIALEAFPEAQPPTNYQKEFRNPLAHYIVVFDTQSTSERPVHYMVGYAGFWLMAGEAHIVDIAVREAYRRRGLGELLLISLLNLAIALNAVKVTLEVRASNSPAISLYQKYGFILEGTRRRYYIDNNEDALIMTTPDICKEQYQLEFTELKKEHSKRWGFMLYPLRQG
jgi:ribosomal-protein-alanine N-acetyltransferase